MRVATCQLPEVHGDMVRAVSQMSAYALEAEGRGADLVCFSECFLQGYDIHPDHIAGVAVELGSLMFDDVLRSFLLITRHWRYKAVM